MKKEEAKVNGDLMVVEPHHSVPPLGLVLPHYYVGHPGKMSVIMSVSTLCEKRGGRL